MNDVRWHRGLVGIAAASAIAVPVLTVLWLVDDREVLNTNVWIKPLKFALSTFFYAIALAWLIRPATRLRRLASAAGWIIVAGLLAELVIIFGFAAVAETSHYNISTPLHTALWGVMAISIVVVWVMTLLIGVVLFTNPNGDAARRLAVRAGVALAIVGMGLAFLMTSPTAQQLASFEGIAGAHAVGVDDGGPGIPFFGWSTEAGDLRIPHFVGMHALQFFPLLALALEWAGRRWDLLAASAVRLRLVRIAVVAFALSIAVLTWQALSAQSIVAPTGPVLVAGISIAVVAAGAVVAVLVEAARVPTVETPKTPKAARPS